MSETASNTDDRQSYEVGYSKPPVHTRFKKGQSGNPRGRPKGARNVKSLIQDIGAETVTLREGARVRKVSKIEALIQQLFSGSLKGDVRSINSLMGLMGRTGLLGEPEQASGEDRLNASEQAIFDALASQVPCPV
jgi:hypothetical protein